MKVFDIKDFKKLFTLIIIIILSCIFLGQVVIKATMNDYKSELIKHDYEVAGYLYRENCNTQNISTAFTAQKNTEDYKRGQALLKRTGYDESTNNALLPNVNAFNNKYTLLVFILSVSMGILLILILFIFAVKFNKTLEKASLDILNFMEGKHEINLDDSEEGSLSKLFSAVTLMATSLRTHITKERQNKEFLKDTISDISHQLKTPLAALEMYNEIILDENINNEVVNKFNLKIKSELTRMQNLIQNLLKLTKLDAGTIELNKEKYKLKDFLEDVTMRFQTRAQYERKKIILNCDNSFNFICDKEWLFEAISNIVKNALDHTNSGNEICISCDNTPVAINITIKDNGSGIHPEDLHYIFKRFYRSRFSQDTRGIGIGLTLSKSIVEKHGGTITVESELGLGTAFHLIFPKLTTL